MNTDIICTQSPRSNMPPPPEVPSPASPQPGGCQDDPAGDMGHDSTSAATRGADPGDRSAAGPCPPHGAAGLTAGGPSHGYPHVPAGLEVGPVQTLPGTAPLGRP